MSEKKMTKSEAFAEIQAIMLEDGYPELAEFAQKEIDALARKAEKAAERAAAKRAEGDEYKAIVAGALTDEFQTGAQIFAEVGDEDFTIGKVRARLTQLVKDGSAEKELTKVEVDGKTHSVMAYRLV